jgi:peptidoglycan/xylan/chitin deacetylase (PgdA/CDA1 family)
VLAIYCVTHAPPCCAKQVEYTLSVLLSSLGIPNCTLQSAPATANQSILISYEVSVSRPGDCAQIHFNASGFFGASYLQPGSLPEIPTDMLLLSNGDRMPLLYVAHGDLPGEVICRSQRGHPLASLACTEDGRRITSNVDLIASSFFMLSRYEEVVVPVHDRSNRFPATASTAFRGGFLDRPVVNQAVLLLGEWIGIVLGDQDSSKVRSCQYPEGKTFAISLSHDVDRVHRHPRQAASALVRDCKARRVKAGLSRFARAMREVLARRDLLWTIEALLEIEARSGVRSAFYFTTGHHSPQDPFYSLSEFRIRETILSIQARGHEIGLHGSFNSFSRAAVLHRQRKALEAITGSAIAGVRQHYLQLQVPITWRAQAEAGLQYDTSLGYADYPGFRAGFCLPFRPFDVLENKVLDLWELPLIAMDGTLYQYRGLSAQESLQVLLRLIETVKKYRGVFTFLWHSSMSDPDDSGVAGFSELYPRLLAIMQDEQVFCCPPGELISRWEQRFCNRIRPDRPIGSR